MCIIESLMSRLHHKQDLARALSGALAAHAFHVDAMTSYARIGHKFKMLAADRPLL